MFIFSSIAMINWIASLLPNQWADRWQVYARLMRLDKPIGTLLLLWPTWWALWLAADGLPPLEIVVAFTLGTLLMRSAGCVINDYADRDFDGAVERTKNRPFAQGEVAEKEALILVAVLCVLAALCLLPLNSFTWLMSLPALFLAMTYPFTKRFFPLPQLYLGLAFSFGIPMAFAAVSESVPLQAWLLFAANICWTLAYDTIYAIVDKEDDVKIGIQTSAITFGRYDVRAVMVCHLLFVLLLAIVGDLMALAWPYWLALCAVVVHQVKQYFMIRHRDRTLCFQVFLNNNQVGMMIFIGILAALCA